MTPRDCLPAEREVALCRAARSGDPRAEGELLLAHKRLLDLLVRRYLWSGIDFEDLSQEASIGFLRGLRKFDPERGFRLRTYTHYWVRAQLTRFLDRNTSIVCRGTTSSERFLAPAIVRFVDQIRRTEGDLEFEEVFARIGEKLSLAPGVVRSIWERRQRPDQSLDVPVSGDRDETLLEGLVGPALPADEVAGEVIRSERIRKVLEETVRDEREAVLVRDRILSRNPARLRDLSERFGITREGVRQVEARFLARARRGLSRLLDD